PKFSRRARKKKNRPPNSLRLRGGTAACVADSRSGQSRIGLRSDLPQCRVPGCRTDGRSVQRANPAEVRTGARFRQDHDTVGGRPLSGTADVYEPQWIGVAETV